MIQRLHSLGELGETLDKMYTSGLTLKDWSAANVPDKDLICKSGLGHQCRNVDGVAAIQKANPISGKTDSNRDIIHTPIEPRVVGKHSSMSVGLPVTCLKFNPFNQAIAYAFIRDNFYDIKVCIISDSPITLPYDLIHYEWSEEGLEKEKKRYLGYHPTEKGIRLMAEGSDDWFTSNWSSDVLLRKNGRIYRAGTVLDCYCEGINRLGLPEEVFQVYQDDMKMFSCSLGSYGKVAMVLEHVVRSLERERYKRCNVWNEQHDLEEAK